MKKVVIICTILLNINFSFSQITGRCIDTLGKPLIYVNIALKNTTYGTVTNTDGYFTIDHNSLKEKNNYIVISHIGYLTKTVIVSNKTENKIVMEEVDFELDEVSVVMSKFTKEKRIGNNKLSKNVVVGFNSHNLGTETGKFFKVSKGEKYKVERIHFNIERLGYKKATFRINFYNTNDKGIEKIRYNSKDIIMEVSNKGDVDINVKNENLVFENSFLVAIEWVGFVEKTTDVPIEEKLIYFSSNVFSGPYYFRSNNLMKWASFKQKYDLGLGMQLFVKY